MPLDGHAFLTAQGWQGKGQGLRQGAIHRPIAAPLKSTKSGVGKDKVEAFAFWEHAYTVAASSIKISIDGNESDQDSGDSTTPSLAPLNKTTTGILSNRRPVLSTPTDSGATTPVELPTPLQNNLSLAALAKRTEIRQRLYSRFYRGAVLSPECDSMPPFNAEAPQKKRKRTHDTDTTDETTSLNIMDGETGSSKEQRRAEKRKRKQQREERRKRKAEKRAQSQSMAAVPVDDPEPSPAPLSPHKGDLQIEQIDPPLKPKKRKRKKEHEI
ncbi:hypothetical protein SISNIDRAFT_451740 [Sistotremastrum niveocremeum HHB9708]|uniref:G-patch domain-containing protein n=1 Tax=Sistotremastrum niveocremeum HHB9708 TaxID=1314777 RepID=A0A164XK11_9AGAM|nr:hypothetical protein SISNIDRAFT_451740 [Sistotremastrum niveocremeum HHB9708]